MARIRNVVEPSANRLMARPATIASPLRSTTTTPNTSDSATAATTAASTPTTGEPVQATATTAQKEPISIRPSRAMLKMPARSVSSPPRAASRMGETMRTVDASSATSRTAASSFMPAARPGAG